MENPYNSYYDDTLLKQREAKSVFSRFHLALFFYMLIPLVLTRTAEFVLLMVMPDKAQELFSNIYFLWLFNFVPMYLVATPVLWLIVRNMKTRERAKSKLSVLEFFAIFLVCQAAMMIGNSIGSAINGVLEFLTGKSVGDAAVIDLIERTPIWLMFVIVVVIGPIVEEFIFRKLMIDRLSRYGDFLAILVSALAFGLVHGNIEQFFYAAFIGIILGYVYTKTGNWLYNTALHMLLNFLGSVVSTFFIDMMTYVEEAIAALQEGLEIDVTKYLRCTMAIGSYSAIQYALVAAGIAVFIYALVKRKIHINPEREHRLLFGTTFNTVFLNPGYITFAVLLLISFTANAFLA